MEDVRHKLNRIINEGKEVGKIGGKNVTMERMLKYIPVAQIRTNKNKAFVFVLEDYVLKGPLSKPVYNNIVKRSKKFVKLGLDDIIIPVFSTLEIDDKPYVAFKRIKGRDGKLKEYKEPSTGLTYNVMERTNVEKLATMLPDSNIYESPQFKRYIFALCVCFILKVGDMGLHNTLYDQKTDKIYIIDYDNNLGKDRDDEYFYFNKPAPAKYQLYKYTSKIHPSIIKKLKKIKEEIGDEDRYKLCISNLKKYSDIKESSVKKTSFYAQKHMITYSGYKVDEIVSGLQKYIRRGMRTKAVKCAVDLIKLGGSIRKNLCNRLDIIAAEDVGIANPDLVVYTIDTIMNKEPNDKKLINITVLLCESDHSRAGSHINAYFSKKPELKIHYDIDKYIKKYKKYYSDKDNKYLIKLLCKFEYWYRKEKSLTCVYYVKKIFDLSFSKEDPLRLGKTNPMREVWNIMNDETREYEVLYKAFWGHHEKRPFLMFYILIKLSIEDYEYERPDTEINKSYYDYLDENYELELDDYVFDKHTAKGRSEGKDRKDFIEEGSYVVNEYMPSKKFKMYKEAYEND